MAVQRQRPGEVFDIVRHVDERTFDVTLASGTYRITMPQDFSYPTDRRGIRALDNSLLGAARTIEASARRRLSDITPRVAVTVQPVEIVSVTPRRGMQNIEAFYRSEGGQKAERMLRDMLREIYPESGGAGSMVRWAFGENADRGRPMPSEDGMRELRAAFYHLVTSTATHDVAALRANGITAFTQIGGGGTRVEIDATLARTFLRSWILEYSSERSGQREI